MSKLQIFFITGFAAFATFLAVALTGSCISPFLAINEMVARGGRV